MKETSRIVCIRPVEPTLDALPVGNWPKEEHFVAAHFATLSNVTDSEKGSFMRETFRGVSQDIPLTLEQFNQMFGRK